MRLRSQKKPNEPWNYYEFRVWSWHEHKQDIAHDLNHMSG